jgi:hypothetical protein
MYQLIFKTPITAPSAMYTDQYSDTHLLPRPQYWTHTAYIAARKQIIPYLH